ncbi:MAG: hypothetical protein SCM96_00425 [Acidobacteriota bacterium]|nr:hypothetical protein [Acidobacteriota bacterium]
MASVAILLGALSLSPGLLFAAQEEVPSSPLLHVPVESFTHGEKIPFSLLIEGEAEYVRLLFRHHGIEEFQVRPMDRTMGAGYVFHLETADLPHLTLEYYLEAGIGGETFLLPVDAPKSCFQVEGQSLDEIPEVPENLPDPQAQKTKIEWPLNFTGSTDYPVWEDGPVADPAMQSAGNLALDLRLGRDPNSYVISANTSYSNQPMPGENPFNLSNMLVSLASNHHSLKAGDLFIQETEFTATGLGRRGVSYGFDNRKITFSFFSVQSQQVKGFDGFGIPKAGVGLIGGSLGFRFWRDRLSMKAVFVDGKDDPRLGANVGASYFNATARKGRVVSLSPEARLLQNKMTLGGEIAFSEFDGDLSDEEPARSDHAWRLGGGMNFGKVQVQSTVRRIGKEFQPIGQQFFTKDRLGHDTTLSATLGRLNLFGSFSVMRDNVDRNPQADTTGIQAGNVNINWTPFRWLSMTLGYQMNSQDTRRDDGFVLFQQDSRMNAFSGGLNLTLGSSMVLTFQASETEQSSRHNPSAAMTSRAINLGGMFRGGQVLTLNPTVSYTHSQSPYSGNDMHMLGSFVLMDVQIIREILSTAVSGSYSRTETGGFGVSENINVSGFLNLNLRKLIRIGNLVLSGQGSYGQMGMGGMTQTTKAAALKCDFSF